MDYFIENSFAAYPEIKVGNEIFNMILKSAPSYPAMTV